MLLTEPASVLLFISFVWLVFLTAAFVWIIKHYRRLTENIDSGNLQVILDKILKLQKGHSRQVKDFRQDLDRVIEDSELHIQKVALVRFNPFPETGGDHSFCLALLDAADCGFVLTGLHARDVTRFYIKPIKKGRSSYELSSEEKEAISKASKRKK